MCLTWQAGQGLLHAASAAAALARSHARPPCTPPPDGLPHSPALRLLPPPTQQPPESKELLTYCIKRVRGLSKVKLVDAAFVWTEPHSMRLKAKLTIQGEVLNGAILQQSFIVEYVVERHMCPTCNRQNANPNAWVACVQVRRGRGCSREAGVQ